MIVDTPYYTRAHARTHTHTHKETYIHTQKSFIAISSQTCFTQQSQSCFLLNLLCFNLLPIHNCTRVSLNSSRQVVLRLRKIAKNSFVECGRQFGCAFLLSYLLVLCGYLTMLRNISNDS